MPNLSSLIKSIRDIMREELGPHWFKSPRLEPGISISLTCESTMCKLLSSQTN